MKPRGPLMIKHRLIEKMLEVVRNQSQTNRQQLPAHVTAVC
ncbi:MAG: hypothetical protein WCJ75_04425 [Desulfomonile sp.]